MWQDGANFASLHRWLAQGKTTINTYKHFTSQLHHDMQLNVVRIERLTWLPADLLRSMLAVSNRHGSLYSISSMRWCCDAGGSQIAIFISLPSSGSESGLWFRCSKIGLWGLNPMTGLSSMTCVLSSLCCACAVPLQWLSLCELSVN